MQPVSFARRAAHLSPTLPPAASPDTIAFDSGHAFPALLPDLTTEGATALTQYRSDSLQYAPRAGLPELRAWIADYMRADGATVRSENVLVTNGAKHALELVCRLLLDEGDGVVVTAPTYFSAIPILRSYGAVFVEVPQDRAGLDVDVLASILDRLAREGRPVPKFIYDVPDYHNPTGVTLSYERRVALLELAARHQIAVVEDSPYRRVRFEGNLIPSLKALERPDAGTVIHLGTFSKLMAPGLRVGWVAAPASLVARMAQLKTDAGSCPLTQRIVVEFCSAGRLDAHVERVQDRYRSNRDHMVAALERELPETSFEIPHGGYYIWLRCPAGVDGEVLATRAGEAGVAVTAGRRFFATSDARHPRNYVRLAYSHATHDEIDEGVRRLAKAFAEVANRPAVAAPALR